MSERYDERGLKRETEAYWDKLRRNYRRRLPVWREYVRDLLPLEMEGKPAPKPCHTLVLLVGHSIEPLLQSVWAYKPQELLLILNQQYDEETSGRDFAKDLCDLLSLLPEDRQVPDERISQVIVQAKPTDVFQALVKRVHERENVIVDITGAKKSMVAGAFLYAAYADVPVSYVDFDAAAYSTKYGRPYGYDSHIRLFKNPYTVFALRDWERVQRLYNSYHFREARRLLEEEIIPVMQGSLPGSGQPYFEPEHIAATEKLVAILYCYELWDGGDFQAAQREAHAVRDQGISFKPPTAIDSLGNIWPYASETLGPQDAAKKLLEDHRRLTSGEGDPANSIFCHADWLVVYAEDELARIERLIEYNEDYRSALLRAASLSEMLLKARWAYLWHDGKLVAPRGQSLPPFDILVEKATARPMLWVLGGKWQELRVGRRENGGTAVLAPGAKELKPFRDGWALDLETVIELRNKTVHTYLSVPRSIAEGAADVARRNLHDYHERWAVGPLPDVVVHTLEWRELCELCGADAFLSPNLLD